MTEDNVPLTNLEDDTPTAPVAETPPAPPVETPPEHEAAEVEAVEVAGKKYVPVGALIGERKQRQALEETAKKAEQYEAYLNQNGPYIEFLKQNPDFLKRAAQPEPVPTAAPSVDPEAEEAARLMDFYTPEGKPDVEKGARYLAMQDRRAQRVTQQTMQPLVTQNQQQAMYANYQRVLQLSDPFGNKPSEAAVRAVFQQLASDPNGLKSAADPQMAPILGLWAMGADRMMSKPQPKAPEKPPLETEIPGGLEAGPRAPLSDVEQRILKNRGMTQARWAEVTKGFTPGKSTVLED